MALIEFKNKPDTETPINAPNLNYNFNEVLNLIYPIGAIMIRADNIDYSDYLGFEWERTLVGKAPVGIDSDDTDFNVIGKIMGEKKHTLTVDEMPSHKHQVLMSYTPNSEHTHSNGTYAASFSEGANPSDGTYSSLDDRISNTGGNQPHNIIQPSQIVAFWKRIA